MKILNPAVSCDKFFDNLPEYDRKILFLDYDGTLAPFVKDPAKAVPYNGVRELLKQLLEETDTRLIIVTGRYTKDIIPLLGMEKIPEIWGSHGLEHLKPDGTYRVADIKPAASEGLQKARNLVTEEELKSRLEEKPGCLALHWRGFEQEQVAQIRSKYLELWKNIACTHQLLLKEFDGGLELRSPGKNKGDAVREVMAGITEKKTAAYLGDDATDEDAFSALKGSGLTILVRKELRKTGADLWIEPPGELLDFLHRWLEVCRSGKRVI